MKRRRRKSVNSTPPMQELRVAENVIPGPEKLRVNFKDFTGFRVKGCF